MKIITSDNEFIKKILQLFKKGKSFEVYDDEGYGFKKEDFENAFNFLKKIKETTGLSWNEIGQILTGIGLSAAGIWIVRLAIIDPEPTSKLGLLVASGAILILSGGFAILKAFGSKWNVNVNLRGNKFSIIPVN
jgi:hypothetical protein